jgi:5'-nucleotidase
MKPLILVTNDDGINAPGIKALVEIAQQLGEVIVVAPDSPQSGQGHAITLENPLRLYEVELFGEIPAYECSGTPADCVKLAKHVLLKDRQIDLCVSGINHGSNASINIIYSGTMSAAMEASIEGIPSIGFSLLNYRLDADFTTAKIYVQQIITEVLQHKLQETLLLNVNIPNVSAEEIKGVKVCRQAEGHWAETFIENTDPSGRPYYWLSGEFTLEDDGEDTDIWALNNNYVSVVPSMHDLTAHPALTKMKYLEKFSSKTE